MVAEGTWSTFAVPLNTVRVACGGAREDVEELIRASWPHAYRIARSILRDRWLAEDAAQEACSILFRSIGELRSPGAFKVWFYRIVVHESLAILKRQGAIVESSDEPALDDLGGSILRMDVLHALGRLSPRQRAIVALHYYAGLNSREIGKVLRVPDGTVRFHLSTARRALEPLLTEKKYVET